MTCDRCVYLQINDVLESFSGLANPVAARRTATFHSSDAARWRCRASSTAAGRTCRYLVKLAPLPDVMWPFNAGYTPHVTEGKERSFKLND